MGYTVYTRQQITPRTITVHGPNGPEQALNRGEPPAYPPTFVQKVWEDTSDLYGADPAKRTELWSDAAGYATATEVFTACPGLKPSVIARIKTTRKEALAATVTSAGILAIYDENYRAAVAVNAGQGDVTTMKDGQSATAYMAGFGTPFGMTAAQFADYIIGENRRVNPTAYQIEQEYLRLAYSVIPASTDVTAILAAPDDFRRFCGL